MPYRELMQKRLKFLNIDENTIAQLQKAKHILEPAMDKMLDKFYSHILEEPELKPLFPDKSGIDRARSAQKKHWMDAMFKGEYDNSYYEKTSQIGRAHARIGLTPNWYIGGYNQMMCQFIELIYENYAEKDESVVSLIQTVSKIIFLDMDLVIHCYLDSKDESLRRLLVSSSEIRAKMWGISDDLNALASEIKTKTKVLSDNPDDIKQNAKELVALVDQLNNQAKGMDGYLQTLPLSEKLYLPKESFFTRLKNQLFEKRYNSKNTH